MIEIALAWLPRLLQAALLTITLSALISAITGPVGAALALALYGREAKAPRVAVEAFSALFRGIPELVVLFLFYFGASQLGLDLGAVGSTVVGFALVGAAYDYQVFKGALAAIPVAQYEVGRALGMPAWLVYWKVILPQMLPLAKRGWITYAIGTVKRISIASAISVSEILYVTKQGIAATGAPFLFLGLAIGLYVLIVSPLLVWNESRGGAPA